MLQKHLLEARSIVVVTGAGISVASGIAPFRKDKDAVWEQDILEMGTFAYFKENPVESWKWYRRRFSGLATKEPNAAHLALKNLEDWTLRHNKRFCLITQNIDALHRKAGSQNVIEIHGRSDCVRCSISNCLYGEPFGRLEASEVDFRTFDGNPCFENIPKCPACQSPVRAHVLWFDETYDAHMDYQFDRALMSVFDGHLIIFIGTSFSVGITDSIWQIAIQQNIPMFAIDPSPTKEIPNITWIEQKSEQYLPTLVENLLD